MDFLNIPLFFVTYSKHAFSLCSNVVYGILFCSPAQTFLILKESDPRIFYLVLLDFIHAHKRLLPRSYNIHPNFLQVVLCVSHVIFHSVLNLFGYKKLGADPTFYSKRPPSCLSILVSPSDMASFSDSPHVVCKVISAFFLSPSLGTQSVWTVAHLLRPQAPGGWCRHTLSSRPLRTAEP